MLAYDLIGFQTRDDRDNFLSYVESVLNLVVHDGIVSSRTHVARMSAAGISRAVRPAHTLYDGDVVFCGATGVVECEPTLVGAAGADVVAEALRRGVRA